MSVKRASCHQDNRTPVRHLKCFDHRNVDCIAGVSFTSLHHSKFFKSPIIQIKEKVVRIVLSIFVAALIVQTTAISKSFADCPPNCRKGNQSAPPASPPPSNPPPK